MPAAWSRSYAGREGSQPARDQLIFSSTRSKFGEWSGVEWNGLLEGRRIGIRIFWTRSLQVDL